MACSQSTFIGVKTRRRAGRYLSACRAWAVAMLALAAAGLSAETTLRFVEPDTGCGAIVPWPERWQRVAPELPDPPKIPLFAAPGEATEWKRLYLPRRELAAGEIDGDEWRERVKAGHGPGQDQPQPHPGLLVNSQPWIDLLRTCPERISSNRSLSVTNPDWIAPDFFELYSLPLAGQSRQVVVTRFTDRGARFGGEYLALYLADLCPGEKLFVSQGAGQQLELLQADGQLVLALKSPEQRLLRYLTFVPQPVDNSYFVETCRTILRR